MSFGGQSNQPWQRNMMPFQNVAPQQLYMQGSSNYGQMQSGGQMYGNGAGNAAVAFPQTYNSIGTVTKINSDCGLVNDEIFFCRNVCKGSVPKLGDRVLFEANLSTTGQFKWNATRIQSMAPQPLMAATISGVVDHKSSGRYSKGGSSDFRGSHHSPSRDHSFRGDRPDRPERRDRESEREHIRRSRDREDSIKMAERDRKRRREDVDRSRDPEREDRIVQSRPSNVTPRNREEPRRDRALSNERKERERIERLQKRDLEREREREREKERDIRGPRSVRRYKVQIPKHNLICHELTIPDIRQRYPYLYVPSLFFHADILWPQHFTFEKPFSLRRACQFHFMPESVEPLVPFKKEELEPADVDYSYSAKVILLECPSLADIYEKCFKDDGEDNSAHLSRLIRFLFGTRGDNSPMAIGGYWSPSLDGPNPSKDPAVLIKTAIRTCRALTGIDLSNCTQWYRFCEYHYENEKNSSERSRVETVVIFLPDVHSCMPTVEEWQKLTSAYKSAAENLIASREQLVAAANNSKTASNNDAETEAMDTSTTSDGKETSKADDSKLDAGDSEQLEDKATKNDDSTAEEEQAALDKSTDGENIIEKDTNKNEPTHYSKLDLKSMKVQEMRDELIARNLSSKGVRTVIMARLAKAINTEKAEEAKSKRKEKLNAKFGIKNTTVKESPLSKTSQKTENDNDEDIQIMSDENGTQNKSTTEEKEDLKDNESKKSDNKETNDSTAKLSEGKSEEQDDQEEWEGGMDVDMNDIVILDEYDSRKIPEETQMKEFTEKDKERIMRRHTLPSTPHIIVHPNKAAKGGKFDCMVTSLSTLFEYGPGDTKQRFFEVALFAELLKELLMRDFSFNIYKEIYFYNQSKAHEQNESESNEKNLTKNKEDKTAQKNENEKSSKENNVDGKSEEGQSTKSSNKRSKANSSTNDEKDKDKEVAKENRHMVTVKPHLLLSFLFFDSTHCGYIYKRDLEEMFYLCGLSLSRAQIHNRVFLDKLATANAFYYRQLTDKEGKPNETPTIEDIEEIDTETLKKIASGNFALLEARLAEGEDDEIDESAEAEDGLIDYNGTIVHVGKLVDQIKRTEKNLSDIEKLHNDLRKEHTDLQKTYTRASNKVKDLQSEVKSLSHKLTDTNRELNSINRKYREEHSVLSLVYNRLTPFVGRDKERDRKSESSRKDKGKEKPKEKEESKKEDERAGRDKTKEKAKIEEKESKKNGEDTQKSESKADIDDDHQDENNGENSESVDASNNEDDNENENGNEEEVEDEEEDEAEDEDEQDINEANEEE